MTSENKACDTELRRLNMLRISLWLIQGLIGCCIGGWSVFWFWDCQSHDKLHYIRTRNIGLLVLVFGCIHIILCLFTLCVSESTKSTLKFYQCITAVNLLSNATVLGIAVFSCVKVYELLQTWTIITVIPTLLVALYLVITIVLIFVFVRIISKINNSYQHLGDDSVLNMGKVV